MLGGIPATRRTDGGVNPSRRGDRLKGGLDGKTEITEIHFCTSACEKFASYNHNPVGQEACDVLPIKRAIWNLVKFVFPEESGREEAVYG